MRIGIAIPTYRAEKFLVRLLPLLQASSLDAKLLVVDSSSDDDTVKIAQQFGAETIVIPKKSFNHGATREMARQALKTDIVVMLTQDVIPCKPDLLQKLIAPIVAGEAAVSYARQIPHDGAGWLEAFPRTFNYPSQSELRSVADVEKLGAYTFFCSDSCAAWSNEALNEIGGFETTVSLEDTIAVAKLLHQGYKIAYRADAVVKHSHGYTLKQEFDRYFIIGYVRRRYRELLNVGGGDEGRGALFVGGMFKRLTKEKPLLIPYAIVSSAVKLFGYRAGWFWNAAFPDAL